MKEFEETKATDSGELRTDSKTYGWVSDKFVEQENTLGRVRYDYNPIMEPDGTFVPHVTMKSTDFHVWHIYTRPDGTNVRVNFVTTGPIANSGWSDQRCIGEIVHHVGYE